MKTRYRTIVVALAAVSAIALCLFLLGRQSQQLYRVTILPSLGGDAMGAHAINDRGQVVGTAQTADDKWHFFFWDPQGGTQDLGVTGGGRFDLNNACQIAGSMIDPNGNEQAFLWECDKGRMLLGTLGGKASRALGINDGSCVVGPMRSPGRDSHMGMWHKRAGPKELFPLPLRGQTFGLPLISDANQIVFDELDAKKPWWLPQKLFHPRSRHCLWDPNRGVISLDRYVPGRRNESFYAMDINSEGCIVGILNYQPKPPQPARARAIVLEPIPERWGK
jgi:probable HAF family extracellular repeat protein